MIIVLIFQKTYRPNSGNPSNWPLSIALPFNQRALGSRRSAPEQSVISRTSSLDVSLDRCVLPEPVGPFTLWGTGVSASLLAVAIGARIPRLAIAIG